MIGLGTYSFFWQWHESAERPLSWRGMLDKTREWGLNLFQFCDYPLLDSISVSEMSEIARSADGRDIKLELGTRGLDQKHLEHYLALCEATGSEILRSMILPHQVADAVSLVQDVLPTLERTGVKLSLETYEQGRVSKLIEIVRTLSSEHIGICLDPVNSMAALDTPDMTIPEFAPFVNNVHVKDFSFSRRDCWIGFTYVGNKLGEGLLDYPAIHSVAKSAGRESNRIIEHWIVWQGDHPITAAMEDEWTLHSIDYLNNYKEVIKK